MLNEHCSCKGHAHQFAPKNPGHDKDMNKKTHQIYLSLLNKLKIREHSYATTFEAASPNNQDRSNITPANRGDEKLQEESLYENAWKGDV